MTTTPPNPVSTASLAAVWTFLSGKKTYIVAIVVGLTAAAQALGYTIPPWVDYLEGALGLTTVRSAISNSNKPTV